MSTATLDDREKLLQSLLAQDASEPEGSGRDAGAAFAQSRASVSDGGSAARSAIESVPKGPICGLASGGVRAAGGGGCGGGGAAAPPDSMTSITNILV